MIMLIIIITIFIVIVINCCFIHCMNICALGIKVLMAVLFCNLGIVRKRGWIYGIECLVVSGLVFRGWIMGIGLILFVVCLLDMGLDIGIIRFVLSVYAMA